MGIKHHLIKQFHKTKQAPLWKWVVVILLVVAIPLLYTFVDVESAEQVLADEPNIVNAA